LHDLLKEKDMKKLWVALTVALLVSVAIGVGAASATHSNGEGPKQDLVSGTSQFEGGASMPSFM
jgi:hypothetical protein